MKTPFFKQGFLAIGIACCMQLSAVENPVDYVNTLVGTQSKYELSTGNTYPATAMPWGMNFWTPQTGEMGNGWTIVTTRIRSGDSSKPINRARG